MTVVERAFALARGGTCASVRDIRLQLKKEGFSAAEVGIYLAGPAIRKQLGDFIAAARSREG